MDNWEGLTMLDADTFATAVHARVHGLGGPRDVMALAVEAIALRSLLDSVTDLTDALAALLDDDADPELALPIAECLDAIRDRVAVGMVTIADIVGRVAA